MAITVKKWDIYIGCLLIGLNKDTNFPVIAFVKPSTLRSEEDVVTVLEIGDSVVILEDPRDDAPEPEVMDNIVDVTDVTSPVTTTTTSEQPATIGDMIQAQMSSRPLDEVEHHLLDLGDVPVCEAAIDEAADFVVGGLEDEHFDEEDQEIVYLGLNEIDKFLTEEDLEDGHPSQASG